MIYILVISLAQISGIYTVGVTRQSHVWLHPYSVQPRSSIQPWKKGTKTYTGAFSLKPVLYTIFCISVRLVFSTKQGLILSTRTKLTVFFLYLCAFLEDFHVVNMLVYKFLYFTLISIDIWDKFHAILSIVDWFWVSVCKMDLLFLIYA